MAKCYPVTPFGQGVAVFLMLVGIGLIGVLTATVASYFVQEKRMGMEERLERIEAMLVQLMAGENNKGDASRLAAGQMTDESNELQ